jgi:hypothetical protein
MPNWVFNRVYATGLEAEVQRFIEQAKAMPNTFVETDEDKWNSKFSFANFIAPPQGSIDSGEYHETKGWVGGKESGNTDNNWYNFNTREWRTKWDAGDASLEAEATSANFEFQTAWSSPEPVFKAMVEQFPELEFAISYEEEQGWGGELVGSKGELTVVKEYDIPDSHSDYVEREREDSCNCSWAEDKDDWYDDCPNKREIFVQVTKVYRLSSSDPTEARAEYLEIEMGEKELPVEESDLGSFVLVDEDGKPLQD